MLKAGMRPQTITWNAVLGAQAKADNIDNALVVWEQMRSAKVVPDDITLRILADAFADNTAMAAQAVQEALQLRVGVETRLYLQGAGGPCTASASTACIPVHVYSLC